MNYEDWEKEDLIVLIIRLRQKIHDLQNEASAHSWELSERRHADGLREAWERGKAGIYG